MQNSAIEWTDHTWNPWWGCIKVSPGCEHCYADTLAHRYGFNVWGPSKTTSRRMMSENYWKQPRKWNKEAAAAGIRLRVFCASMADVFEDHPQLTEPRARLFDLISECSALDWLLLTKRPENIKPMLIEAGRGFQSLPPWVWIGTSVENQEQADQRIPHLLRVPAAVRFLSCEPLLGPVDLTKIKCGDDGFNALKPDSWEQAVNAWRDTDPDWVEQFEDWFGVSVDTTGPMHARIDWVIVGGESGHGARPMHPDWARSLRDQCQSAGVAFFMKQMGGAQHKGGSLEDMPADLRIREMPESAVTFAN